MTRSSVSRSREVARRAAATDGTPDDANDLRGSHFRELLHKPLTWILVGGASLVLGIDLRRSPSARRSAGSPSLVAFAGRDLASSSRSPTRAPPTTSSHVYAEKPRPRTGRQDHPAAGDAVAAQGRRPLRGADAERPDRAGGRRHARDSSPTWKRDRPTADGNTETTYHPLHAGRWPRSPSASPTCPELYCQRKGGLRSLEKFEDVFRRSKRTGRRWRARRWTTTLRDLRRQGPGRESGCAGSSRPPSSSG